ncbi:MAG: helix-turn-helix domain-containing protein [Pirellulales bacterium]
MSEPKAEPQLPSLLTIQELAAVLKISQRSIWRLVSNGQLVKPIRIGGSVRWRVQDVKEWVDNGCDAEKQKPR